MSWCLSYMLSDTYMLILANKIQIQNQTYIIYVPFYTNLWSQCVSLQQNFKYVHFILQEVIYFTFSYLFFFLSQARAEAETRLQLESALREADKDHLRELEEIKEQLEKLLEEERQAKRDEELVRIAQAR